MKIIISPAKKLTTEKITIKKFSAIQFSDEARYLVDQLKNYEVNEIKQLMGLSDNLAQLNYERFQQWDLNSDKVNPAIYMFQGDVFQGLKAETLTTNEIEFAQEHLRILSGLYGLLKPLDLVFPYRLEMGTKVKTKAGKNLYEFWDDKLSKALSAEMKKNDMLVNLASNEYSKVLQLEKFQQPIITPVFKDFKNGKLKIIAFFAKKARGSMVRYIVDKDCKTLEDVKGFDYEGYRFSEEHTEKAQEPVFIR